MDIGDFAAEAPSASSPPAVDPNESGVSRWLTGADDAAKLGLSVSAGSQRPPEQAVRVLKLAAKTGLPQDLIERNTDAIEQQAAASDFDPVKFQASSPIVSSWLAEHPNHAAVASEDLTKLGFLERQIGNIKDQWRRGVMMVELAKIGERKMFGSEEPYTRLGQLTLGDKQAYYEKQMAASPDYGISGFFAGIPGAVANQLPIFKQSFLGKVKAAAGGAALGAAGAASAGALSGAAAAGPEGAALGAIGGAVEGGEAGGVLGWKYGAAVADARIFGSLAYLDFEKLKDENGQPIDRETAMGAASIVGVINGSLGMIPFESVLKNTPVIRQLSSGGIKTLLETPTARQAFLTYAKHVGQAAATGGGVGFIQSMVQSSAGELAKMTKDGSVYSLSPGAIMARIFSDDNISKATENARMGAQGAGGMSAGLGALSLSSDLQRARVAQANAAAIKSAGDSVGSMKVFENLPQQTRDLIGRMSKDGEAENLHAPVDSWNQYWQSYKDEKGQPIDPREVAREVVGDTQSYDDAVRTGSDIVIPTDRYLTTIGPHPEHGKFFADEVRVRPDEMNGREAGEFAKTMEQKAAADQSSTEPMKSAGKVFDAAAEQLRGAGYDDATASTYAKLYEKAFETLGARAGVDPFDLFQRYGLKVQRQLPDMVLKAKNIDALDPAIDRLRSGDIPTEAQAYGPHIVDYLRSIGGIRPVDEGADLVGMDPDAARKPFEKNLINPEGNLADDAAQSAVSAGYLPERDISAMMGAIDKTLRGEPVYAAENASSGHIEDMRSLRELGDYLHKIGADPATMTNEEIKALLKSKQEELPAWVTDGEAAPEGESFMQKALRKVKKALGLGKETQSENPAGSAEGSQIPSTSKAAEALPSEVSSYPKSVLDNVKNFKALFGDQALEGTAEILRQELTRAVAGGLGQDEAIAARLKLLDTTTGAITAGIDEVAAFPRIAKERLLASLTREAERRVMLTGEAPAAEVLSAHGEIVKQLNAEMIQRAIDTPEFKAWFGDSKAADESGKPLILYHGTARPDRVGNKFKRSRATSGPMAFFTDSPEIASKYAEGKVDTSRLSEDDNMYEHWFKYKPAGSRTPVDIARAWYFLPQETRDRIAALAPRVTKTDDGEIILGPEGETRGTGGYDQHIKEARGNHLKALVEEWLSSGNLYDDEEQFMKVLELAGMKDAKWDSPYKSQPAVMPVFLSIKNPLDTSSIPESVLSALEKKAARQRVKEIPRNADTWDKENRDPREWISSLRSDIAEGRNSYVWSSVPDWVTKTLSDLGYDGIKDTGGKGGGTGHDVWIPFEEGQVKSATGNRGSFDPNKQSILEQAALPKKGASESAIQKMVDKAKEYFGTTDDFTEAGYLTKDGELLDFYGRNMGGSGGQRALDHREINFVLTKDSQFPRDEGSASPGMRQFMSYGNIRVKPEIGGVELASPPTRAQERMIERYASERNGELVVDVSSRDERVKFSQEYPEGTPPGQIISDIHQAFETHLEQAAGKGDEARARLRFGPDRQMNIDILKNADLSSFLHETGHMYLEIMGDLAGAEGAKPDMQADYATILKFVGAESRGKIETEGHEKFARAFEAYLMEGKAPTDELRGAFSRFRAWLIGVYRQIQALNVELTPEVRGVFDRMLASQDEIAAAQREQHIEPLFGDPKSVGMNEVDAANYTRAVDEARSVAEEQLSAKIMSQWERARKSWWTDRRAEVRAEVADEINQKPEYIALSVLQSGKLPDGSDLPEGTQPFKLDKKALVDSYGKEFLKRLPRPHVYTTEGGVNPEIAAGTLGFRSGEELVMALANSQNRRQLIEAMTDAKMREQYGDMMTDGSIAVEAMKAVHNDKRSQLLQQELQYLASNKLSVLKNVIRKITRRIAPIDAVRQQAEETIAGKRVRDIYPSLYQRAEARAGREAVDAMLRGDFEAAFESKQRELLNHELYKAASNARDIDEHAVEYMAKFDKASVRQRMGKAGSDYLDQIDAIRERFDFTKSTTLKAIDKRKSLAAWVEAQQAAGRDVAVPQRLLDEAYTTHYKDMTHEELTGVRDAVQMIEHVANTRNKLLESKRLSDLAAARDEITGSIQAHHDVKAEAPDFAPGMKDRLLKKVKAVAAEHTRMEFLFEHLDGNNPHGPVWETLFKPFVDGENREDEMMAGSVKALHEIFSVYDRGERAKWFLDRKYIPEIDNHMTKANILAVALNWGNAYNRDALMRGYGWTEAQVEAVMRSMTGKDWRVVQSVWDHIDTYWPAAEQMEKDINGVAPDKVQADSFMAKTADGIPVQMRGGYYPIVFDKSFSWRQEVLEEHASVKEMFGGNWARAMTRHGHLEARNNTGGKPILLELSGLTNHLTSVIHDLAFRRAVIDAHSIINDPEVRRNIEGAAGREMYRQLNPWLKAIASDRLSEYGNSIEGILGRARNGATIVNLGLKVTTGLVHALGYHLVVKELGPKYAALGLRDAWAKPWEIKSKWDFITERSDMMTHYPENSDRDVRDFMKHAGLIDAGQGVLSAADVYTGNIRHSFLSYITHMNMASAIPAWLGAYRLAMDGGLENVAAGDEKAASEYADQIIRQTKGAGAAKDLASVQRGNQSFKLFTMFYSQMAVQFNQFEKIYNQFRLDRNVPKLLAATSMSWFVPAVLDEVIRGRTPKDDEDPEKLGTWLLRKELMYPFHSIILLRDIAHTLDKYMETGEADFQSSPVADVFSTAAKGLSVPFKMLGDKPVKRNDYRDAVNTAGYALSLPTRQLWLTSEYLYDWMTGNENPDNPMEAFWHAAVIGKTKKGQKK